MKSRIIVPLYIYPSPGAWDPLYTAISSHPDIEFLIIVNPNSGPGSPPWWPNADYVREIPRLNACANVTTLGYVCVTYCQRAIEEVVADIETYNTWVSDARFQNLGVKGIFVDETVNVYEEAKKRYLDRVDAKVKGCNGFGEKRLVIHNPGTAVNRQFAKPGPDVTVVVETSFEDFVIAEYQEWLATSPYTRVKSCYMVHGVSIEKVREVTASLRKRAEYLFVTSAKERVYEGFGPSWEEFVKAVAEP